MYIIFVLLRLKVNTIGFLGRDYHFYQATFITITSCYMKQCSFRNKRIEIGRIIEVLNALPKLFTYVINLFRT